MGNARYGLRGVRVGEASNPGPPQIRIRPRVDVVEDIIVSMEHDLTHHDSDDKLFGSAGSARNVVPRLCPAALDSVVSMSAPAHSIPTQVDREDASSVSSESFWGGAFFFRGRLEFDRQVEETCFSYEECPPLFERAIQECLPVGFGRSVE